MLFKVVFPFKGYNGVKSYILSIQVEAKMLKTIAVTNDLNEAEAIVRCLEENNSSSQSYYKIINTGLYQTKKNDDNSKNFD